MRNAVGKGIRQRRDNVHRVVTTSSPSMLRIVRALEEQGDMDADEISLWAHVARTTLNGGHYLRLLMGDGKIHICGYRRNQQGSPAAIYRAGPGTNARKPRPYTPAQKCARWRKSAHYRKGDKTLVRVLSSVLNIGGRNG